MTRIINIIACALIATLAPFASANCVPVSGGTIGDVFGNGTPDQIGTYVSAVGGSSTSNTIYNAFIIFDLNDYDTGVCMNLGILETPGEGVTGDEWITVATYEDTDGVLTIDDWYAEYTEIGQAHFLTPGTGASIDVSATIADALANNVRYLAFRFLPSAEFAAADWTYIFNLDGGLSSVSLMSFSTLTTSGGEPGTSLGDQQYDLYTMRSVPEPAAAALLLIGAAPILWRRRWRIK